MLAARRPSGRTPDPRHDLAAVRRGRERPGPRRADSGSRGRHRRLRADLVLTATASRRSASRPRSSQRTGHRARLRRPQVRAARRMPATARSALLLGAGAASPASVPLAARAEELRDRWRLAGERRRQRGRRELRLGRRGAAGCARVGARRRRRRSSARSPGRRPRRAQPAAAPATSSLRPSACSARRTRSDGSCSGSAAPQIVVAGAGGLAEAVASEPRDGADGVARRGARPFSSAAEERLAARSRSTGAS